MHSEDRSPQLQFLQRVLSGVTITAADIDKLLAEHVEEDQHLDYKSGQVFDKSSNRATPGHPNTFAGKIRQHVSGFANAEGGVLVIGVGERPNWTNPTTGQEEPDPHHTRKVDGVHRVTQEQLLRRTRDALQVLHPSLSVPFRLQAVEHHNGLVLIVAVPRSDTLVVTVEAQRVIHYLRMHDSTVHAPAFLVEDLMLGRRRKCSVQLTPESFDLQWDESRDHVAILLSIRLKNTGLAWMDNPRVGVIAHNDQNTLNDWIVLFRELVGIMPHLDVRNDNSMAILPEWTRLSADELPADGIGPIDSVVFRTDPAKPICLAWARTSWIGAALCVVSRDQPVLWFQLLMHVDRDGEDTKSQWWIIPCGDKRPVVAVHGLGYSGEYEPLIDWFVMEEHEIGRGKIKIPRLLQ